jgi:hypothetical protein
MSYSSAGPSSSSVRYAPTTTPTPGQALLRQGKMLVYPSGWPGCPKCEPSLSYTTSSQDTNFSLYFLSTRPEHWLQARRSLESMSTLLGLILSEAQSDSDLLGRNAGCKGAAKASSTISALWYCSLHWRSMEREQWHSWKLAWPAAAYEHWRQLPDSADDRAICTTCPATTYSTTTPRTTSSHSC